MKYGKIVEFKTLLTKGVWSEMYGKKLFQQTAVKMMKFSPAGKSNSNQIEERMLLGRNRKNKNELVFRYS